jgi:hypothetical protein
MRTQPATAAGKCPAGYAALSAPEQAVLNQIPGGEAPNVSEQTGWYLYSLPGISGKSKRQINKGERHHSRSQRQHTRKERRKNRRAKIF